MRRADPSRVAEAVVGARRPPCPTFNGLWAFSRTTETAYARRCGRWTCPRCGRFKRRAARLALERGIGAGLQAGRRVRFITLTDRTGRMTTTDMTEAWKRLVGRLRTPRKGRQRQDGSWSTRPRPAYLDEYAVTIEAHATGALHLHALFTGRYIPQRWLATQANEAGFGRVAWIGEITEPADAGMLLDRARPGQDRATGRLSAASYLTIAEKWGLQPVAARSGQRLRPIRLSKHWPGGSLANAERLLIESLYPSDEKDPGPFEMWHESDLHEQPATRAAFARPTIVLVGWPR